MALPIERGTKRGCVSGWPCGQAKIKSRLIAELDPDEWDLLPKPKWMRWRKYDRYVGTLQRLRCDTGLRNLRTRCQIAPQIIAFKWPVQVSQKIWTLDMAMGPPTMRQAHLFA
jgi:hypothetical protein